MASILLQPNTKTETLRDEREEKLLVLLVQKALSQGGGRTIIMMPLHIIMGEG